MNINWNNAYQIERLSAQIFRKQEQFGWYFNKALANQHVSFLTSELERLYNEIRPSLKKVITKPYKTPLNKPFLNNGEYAKNAINYSENYGLPLNQISGPFTRINYEEPSLSSADQVKEQLFRLGWVPTQWNYKKENGFFVNDTDGQPIKTSPKLTEDSYDTLTIGIGPQLRKFMIYDHRLSALIGLLSNVREDGTIPSVVDGCGTPTARVRHSVVANLPRVSTLFGREFRELFKPHLGDVLLGEDRAQIEARIIAHASIIVLGNTKLADAILGRDFHQVIFEALEGLCTDRQAAKTPEYAFFFGAKANKLGKSIDNKPKEWSYNKAGNEVIKLMEKNIPGIIVLRDRLSREAKKGWLKGFDGRKFFVRKQHAALNTYAQGNAQVCCKTAMIMQQLEAKRRGLKVNQMGYYHDETQNSVSPEHAEEFGAITTQAIKETGTWYDLKVTLDGEFKIGNNWAECH